MRSNTEGVSGKETETAQIQRFQEVQPLYFQQTCPKNRSSWKRFQADLEVKLRVSGKQLWCTALADAPTFSMMLALSSGTELLF